MSDTAARALAGLALVAAIGIGIFSGGLSDPAAPNYNHGVDNTQTTP